MDEDAFTIDQANWRTLKLRCQNGENITHMEMDIDQRELIYRRPKKASSTYYDIQRY